jgi:pilus assembly protein CpaF
VNLSDLDQRLFELISEPGVTDVLIDGARDCWVDRGRGLESRANPFDSEPNAAASALELAGRGGVRLDFAKPFADAVAADEGSGVAVRIHLVLASEVCARTQICIRVLAERPVALEQLADAGMLSGEQLAMLRSMVGKRQNFLVSGATGSGKTTLLRAIASEFAADRIVTIEDIPELRLPGNTVQLLTRESNQEGKGAITADELLIQALRMRPDRILLGEVRGPELLTLLRVINTGHGGVGATVHANSAESVLVRLRGMAQLAGLASSELDSSATELIDWVIHCERLGGTRRVASITKFAATAGQDRGQVSPVADGHQAETVVTAGRGRRRLEVI